MSEMTSDRARVERTSMAYLSQWHDGNRISLLRELLLADYAAIRAPLEAEIARLESRLRLVEMARGRGGGMSELTCASCGTAARCSDTGIERLRRHLREIGGDLRDDRESAKREAVTALLDYIGDEGIRGLVREALAEAE